MAIQCCVYVHDMPCRANCIPSTVTHQWEDWTRMHVEPTAYHRLWPTNEKAGLTVYIPCLTNCMPYHLLLPANEKAGLTVYIYAMPDQLHTIYCHRPMRRLDMYIRYMPRRASCNQCTVNDQWEGCAKATIRRYRPMRRMQSYLSMLCPAHCFLSIATNEKTRRLSHNIDQWEDVTHIFSHCDGPAACNSTLHSYQPMRKLLSSHLKSATDIYLNIWCTNLTPYPPHLQYMQSQVKSTKPYGKKCVKDTELCDTFYCPKHTPYCTLKKKKLSCIRKNAFFYICFFILYSCNSALGMQYFTKASPVYPHHFGSVKSLRRIPSMDYLTI